MEKNAMQWTADLDTSAVSSLPDMQGSGRLRDLQEAATLSPTLASQLASLQSGYCAHDEFCAKVNIRRWSDNEYGGLKAVNVAWRQVS